MSILVTTPTGKVGSRTLRLLVQAGERPTAFLRDATRLAPNLAPLVDVVEGDQHDADDVLRATEGAEALYWVSPPVLDGDPVRAHELAGANIARAVAEHAIERTVFQSSVGAEHRGGMGEIDGLARTEELIDATGRSVTHCAAATSSPTCSSTPTASPRGSCTRSSASTPRCPGSIPATSAKWRLRGCSRERGPAGTSRPSMAPST